MGLFWYKNKRYSVDDSVIETVKEEPTRPVYPVTTADGITVAAHGDCPDGIATLHEGGMAYKMWHDHTVYSAPGVSFCEFYKGLLDTPGGVLVSGATGSGKSVVLNGILCEILGTFCPSDSASGKTCDIFLCDPKIVEFRAYRVAPHVRRYADTPDDIFRVMDEVDRIMMDRYNDMAERGLKMWDGAPVFLFIDEIGDLMLTHKTAFLPRLTHLLNLCRAAKITIFLASQSPSRQTIPAVVQLNCTAKICLKCDTAIESRQVVGIPGGEKLPAHGTALVRTPKTGGIVKQSIPNCTDAQVDKVLRKVTDADFDTIRKQRIA